MYYIYSVYFANTPKILNVMFLLNGMWHFTNSHMQEIKVVGEIGAQLKCGDIYIYINMHVCVCVLNISIKGNKAQDHM